MKENGIRSKTVKKYRAITNSKHSLPVQESVLNREFTTSKPNEKWVTDITYISTSEGWLYLVKVMDLYSRKIVGWHMSEWITKELVIQALKQAYGRPHPDKWLIHHSDRGSQYSFLDYQKQHQKYEMIGVLHADNGKMTNIMNHMIFNTLIIDLDASYFHNNYLLYGTILMILKKLLCLIILPSKN
ncbi:DDE-type integrase/transposase/recombinase [Paenibacillus sp. N3/727]|uniref:DDE-type integrase/transposase/recombinase n=1 Tax=Paenibacillus sp. N3/727 TaxID=2925845 RepID=UPI001F530226|nr:DDE-type integrase/transposase/recombinase [Paenibacillus sp. N3/727]UNK20682.1 DDE-type integrase/transposase/recombinase [Paenibacillus sp. N3/727]